MAPTKQLSIVLVTAAIMLGAIAVAPATAHESQEIDGYELAFGGADEPVVTGERMWLVLSITDEDGDPVPEQADSLEWRIEKPGEEEPIHLEVGEQHGAPGVYESAVVFTEPGEYTVHIEGTVEDTDVHTHFEKEVEDRDALEYPDSNSDDAAEQAGLSSIPGVAVGIAIGAMGAAGAFFLGRRD